jgi:hypothetical protein
MMTQKDKEETGCIREKKSGVYLTTAADIHKKRLGKRKDRVREMKALTLCLDAKEIVKREIAKREIREKRDRKEIE